MKRRFLSLLLVLAMLLSMVPAVSAAGNLPFTDVSSSKWYYDAVQYVYENGLMNGDTSTTFEPENTMTRGMFVTVLGRMVGVNTANYTFNYFGDVNTIRYYAPYINWAAANGIVKGYPGTLFKPDDPITREEMATIFSRYLTMADYDLPQDSQATTFSDANTAHNYAKEHIEKMRLTGLMQGSQGKFDPKNTATRAEAATVFMRVRESLNALNAPSVHQVSFLYNYGSMGTYATYQVDEGNTVQHPGVVTRSGYTFTGWYLDPECTQPYDFTGLVDRDLNLYAGWSDGSNSSNTISGSDEGTAEYAAIYGLTVEGSQVTVTLSSPESAIMGVTFYKYSYNEASKTFDLGSSCGTVAARVPAGTEMGNITAPITTSLPQYYMVRVQLLDASSNVLATYLSRSYTKEYAMFEATTVQDFPEEDGYVVLNFDDQDDNNFGVLAEGVEVLNAEAEIVHEAEDENDASTYRIQDNSVETGDNLMVTIDGEEHLFQAGQVTHNGDGSVTVTADNDAQVQDFYQYLKVDMETYATPDQVDAQTIDAGVTLDADSLENDQVYFDETAQKKLSFSIGLEHDPMKLTGKATGSVKGHIKLNYDIRLFAKDYLEFEFTVENSITLDVALKASLAPDDDLVTDRYSKTLKLGKVTIPFGVSGLSAFTELSCQFDWEVEGGLEYEQVSTTKLGFSYNTDNGVTKVNKKDNKVNLSVSGGVTLEFGPKPAAGAQFLGGALKAKIEVFAGGRVELEAKVPVVSTGDESHCCYLCADGSISAVVEATGSLSYNIADILKANLATIELSSYEKELGTAFVSILNDASSIYQGHIHFGWGDCENLKYKTTIITQDTLGNDVSALAKVVGSDGTTKASITGGSYGYLYPGAYTVSARIDGVAVTRSFTVSDQAQTVILSPQHQDGVLAGTVTDASNNDPISRATVCAYQNGEQTAMVTTDSNGQFSIPLAEGTYTIRISAVDYMPFSTTTEIYPNDTKYLETSLMVKEEENMGGLSGYITDATTGRGISGVTLELYRGWGNLVGTPVATLTTNSSGYYVYDTWTVFGMIWGLPIGNYTIKATHPDYNDMSFNVVVLGDMTLTNQNATMNPLNVEQNYRVVLRWGQTPRDLDSHLNAKSTTGSRVHIYYSSKVGTGGNLDVDDTSSYGPETITITDFDAYANGFTYSVHDYTNRSSTSSKALSSSGASVELWLGDQLLRTYNVPTGKTGTVWNVFSVDQNGTITSLNSFENISAPGSVGIGYVGDALSSIVETFSNSTKDYERY